MVNVFVGSKVLNKKFAIRIESVYVAISVNVFVGCVSIIL